MADSRPNVWQMQSRQDMQGLIQALRYPDPEVRGRAAVALRTLGAATSIPALKAALRDELDEQARKYLTEALHVLDQRTDIDLLTQKADITGLTAALKSHRTDTVIAAARVLGKLGNRLAVEPLIILFQTSTSPPAVRLAAAEALLELKSAPAVVTLLGALRRDSWQVRRNAAAVLGQIQAIWAVEPLAEALRDPHPVVRRTAAAALKRIGTSEAMTALRIQLGGQTEQESTTSDDNYPAASVSQEKLPETPAHTSRFHFDSEPAGLLPASKKPSTILIEKGEIAESHITRPSETTRPVVPKSLRGKSVDAMSQIAEIDVRSHKVESSKEDSEKAADQVRSPVARMIAFLRRRGNDDTQPT